MGAPSRIASSGKAIAICLPLSLGCSSDDSDSCNARYRADIIDFRFTPVVTQAGEYDINVDAPPVSGSCHVVVGATELEPCSSARMTLDGLTDEGVVALSGLQIWFDYAPATIQFAIKDSKGLLVSQQYEPVYVAEAPEGESCQTRLIASISVQIP